MEVNTCLPSLVPVGAGGSGGWRFEHSLVATGTACSRSRTQVGNAGCRASCLPDETDRYCARAKAAVRLRMRFDRRRVPALTRFWPIPVARQPHGGGPDRRTLDVHGHAQLLHELVHLDAPRIPSAPCSVDYLRALSTRVSVDAEVRLRRTKQEWRKALAERQRYLAAMDELRDRGRRHSIATEGSRPTSSAPSGGKARTSARPRQAGG